MVTAMSKVEHSILEPPLLPIRRLSNFVYCPRLFYFQWVENIFVDNEDTIEGGYVHRRVDNPTKDLVPGDGKDGSFNTRSLAFDSIKYKISGVIDLVDCEDGKLIIVEYKKGAAARDDNDLRVAKDNDVIQVAAQALLLKDNGFNIDRAFIYYAAEKVKIEVPLSEALEKRCMALVEAAFLTAEGDMPPPLDDDARCHFCSAYPICLPNESRIWTESSIKQNCGCVDDNKADSRVGTLRAPMAKKDSREVLVVQTTGAAVGRRSDQITVSVKGEVVKRLPLKQVRAIYLYGPVQTSTQLITSCLENEIELAFFARSGRFLGNLVGLGTTGVSARRGQYFSFDKDETKLELAKAVVAAKIHNQRVMLMRNGEAPKADLSSLGDLQKRVDSVGTLQQVLGMEGAAAAIYFRWFSSMLRPRDDIAFDFSSRSRRPPRDPVNALLSLAYSILAKELTGVCYTVGLDPFWGFFHKSRYGKPALALDLMEEFRPLVADSTVITLINRGEVGASDFINSSRGTMLTDGGRKMFWEAWFRRLDTTIKHPVFGYQMSYRRMLEIQARQLWRFVQGQAISYTGFTTR